jgi:hypothetical protein
VELDVARHVDPWPERDVRREDHVRSTEQQRRMGGATSRARPGRTAVQVTRRNKIPDTPAGASTIGAQAYERIQQVNGQSSWKILAQVHPGQAWLPGGG